MRHISLDLIRVTEAAAIAASQYIGSGNKLGADQVATDAIRNRLNKIDFGGKIVICEGIKDQSYGLLQGEHVGTKGLEYSDACKSVSSAADQMSLEKNRPYFYDLAIDPIEGTTPTVTGGPEAISTLAVSRENSLYATDYFYMKKLAYGRKLKEKVELHLNDSLSRIVQTVALALQKNVNQITVCILNRPRHDETIKQLRSLGVRIKLINDCDVSGAIAAALPNTGIDLLYGIGGAPEAILSACAIKCLGGEFLAQNIEKTSWSVRGNILRTNDLVKDDCVFVATGITDGSILNGVKHKNSKPITNSVFMRSSSGTIRWIKTHHGN